jgi:hypothetical protein
MTSILLWRSKSEVRFYLEKAILCKKMAVLKWPLPITDPDSDPGGQLITYPYGSLLDILGPLKNISCQIGKAP